MDKNHYHFYMDKESCKQTTTSLTKFSRKPDLVGCNSLGTNVPKFGTDAPKVSETKKDFSTFQPVLFSASLLAMGNSEQFTLFDIYRNTRLLV